MAKIFRTSRFLILLLNFFAIISCTPQASNGPRGKIPDLTQSSLSCSETAIANGVSSATCTLLVKDYFDRPISNLPLDFSSTDSGDTSSVVDCGVTGKTNSSGELQCEVRSTTTGEKTFAISRPSTIASLSATITFTAQVPDLTNSNFECRGTPIPDGVSYGTCTLTVKDADDVGIPDLDATFSVSSGDSTSLANCSSTSKTNSSGVRSCRVYSTVTGSKTLAVTSPAPLTDLSSSLTFSAAAPHLGNSSFSCTGPVAANGVAHSTCTLTVRDQSNNPMEGVEASFEVSSGASTTISSCNPATTTDASGQLTCEVTSTVVGTKTLTVKAPAELSSKTTTVIFSAQVPSLANSSFECSGSPAANGVSTGTCTMTVKDSDNVAIASTAAYFSVTSGSAVTSSCLTTGNTDASGVRTCTVTATATGARTFTLVAPTQLTSMTASTTFNAQTPDMTNSTFACSGSPVANGVSTGSCTMTIKDADNVVISGVAASFTSSGTGNTISGCSTAANTDASGVRSCNVYSTVAEVKTLAISAPTELTTPTPKSTTLAFSAQVPSVAKSSFSCSPDSGVAADGATNSTCTITVKDSDEVVISGVATTASVTSNSAGSSSTCSNSLNTNGSGVRTCTINASTTGSRTLTLTAPSQLTSLTASVAFATVTPDLTNSSFTCTGGPTANATDYATCTLSVKDSSNAAIEGAAASFSASFGSSVTISNCSPVAAVTDASGERSCQVSSTVAETKVISVSNPSGLTSKFALVEFDTEFASESFSAAAHSNAFETGSFMDALLGGLAREFIAMSQGNLSLTGDKLKISSFYDAGDGIFSTDENAFSNIYDSKCDVSFKLKDAPASGQIRIGSNLGLLPPDGKTEGFTLGAAVSAPADLDGDGFNDPTSFTGYILSRTISNLATPAPTTINITPQSGDLVELRYMSSNNWELRVICPDGTVHTQGFSDSTAPDVYGSLLALSIAATEDTAQARADAMTGSIDDLKIMNCRVQDTTLPDTRASDFAGDTISYSDSFSQAGHFSSTLSTHIDNYLKYHLDGGFLSYTKSGTYSVSSNTLSIDSWVSDSGPFHTFANLGVDAGYSNCKMSFDMVSTVPENSGQFKAGLYASAGGGVDSYTIWVANSTDPGNAIPITGYVVINANTNTVANLAITPLDGDRVIFNRNSCVDGPGPGEQTASFTLTIKHADGTQDSTTFSDSETTCTYGTLYGFQWEAQNADKPAMKNVKIDNFRLLNCN